ncbi:hypothetical protein DKX38_027404 [Salix brachista]|uniref:Uncharacterized protein n=1 Tax=Salix brachista TaxID=2182728 RepID=A0A5N5JDP2_9ROSI|nr:hypothetical protein DKX38_027404 [Salix brachista]
MLDLLLQIGDFKLYKLMILQRGNNKQCFLKHSLMNYRLVEEADFISTTELFAKKGDEKSLDRFIPKSESDFLEYAGLISHKLRSFEESYHYIGLLKAIMRLSITCKRSFSFCECNCK